LEIAEPAPEPLPSDPILMDGACIGYVTSASHGYRTGKRLVLGYVHANTLSRNAACTVRVLGTEVRAVRHAPHVYDPSNQRMKA
ncbi:MAG: glycine cleavage T C-terminal barrel domain-containing protein, partial [Pseudomonadota bacterium]